MQVGAFWSLIAVLVFLTVMMLVTVIDLRTRLIPNWLILLFGMAYWPLAISAQIDPVQMINAVGAAVITFLAGLFLFAKGWIGGGDVKLAAVTVLWLGAGLALPYILLTSIFGAAFTLAGLIGVWLVSRRNGETARPVGGKVPYGPGMACAGLLILQISPWAQAL